MHARTLRPLLLCVLLSAASTAAGGETANARPPKDDADLQQWLENMVWLHLFDDREVRDATGLSLQAVREAKRRHDIRRDNAPTWRFDEHLVVAPYPGGRHPRLGFLEGALRPQRETKFSVFAPWQPEDQRTRSYVVVDAPEAIWSNLGLTYLAHTHVPTIWTEQDVELPELEWQRQGDRLLLARTLPNGIRFTSLVEPRADQVRMTMTLTNGTDAPLTGLRVQNCVMLKGAAGFTQQDNENKLLEAPYAAAHDRSGRRWVITAWKPNHRAWANARCPCLHSDPQFADCPPGETREVRGWLSFFQGKDVRAEIQRIEAARWWVEPKE